MTRKIFFFILALAFFILAAPEMNNFHSNVLQNIRITNVHEDALPAAAVTSQPQVEKTGAINNGEIYYPVTKVIDGDTIAVNINGKSETVRLMGLDTPETVDPRKPVQCFGEQASDEAKKILAGKSVRIEMGPSQGERDKYGRLLAYIFLEDGTLFNQLMIEEGFGHEYTYNLPYKYQEEFKAAERQARENKKGLWAKTIASDCSPEPASQATPSVRSDALGSEAGFRADGSYDCSQNAYNCSSFKTQAEAQKVFDACGGNANDIHKLDSDKDGKVCESLP